MQSIKDNITYAFKTHKPKNLMIYIKSRQTITGYACFSADDVFRVLSMLKPGDEINTYSGSKWMSFVEYRIQEYDDFRKLNESYEDINYLFDFFV